MGEFPAELFDEIAVEQHSAVARIVAVAAGIAVDAVMRATLGDVDRSIVGLAYAAQSRRFEDAIFAVDDLQRRQKARSVTTVRFGINTRRRGI